MAWHVGISFSVYGCDGLMVGLSYLRGLFQPQWFYYSGILRKEGRKDPSLKKIHVIKIYGCSLQT